MKIQMLQVFDSEPINEFERWCLKFSFTADHLLQSLLCLYYYNKYRMKFNVIVMSVFWTDWKPRDVLRCDHFV
jgi:hypothetical protein